MEYNPEHGYHVLTCVGREQPCQEIDRCQLIFLRKLGVDAEGLGTAYAKAHVLLTSYAGCDNLIPDQTWKDSFGASLLMYAQGQKTWDDVVAELYTLLSDYLPDSCRPISAGRPTTHVRPLLCMLRI